MNKEPEYKTIRLRKYSNGLYEVLNGSESSMSVIVENVGSNDTEDAGNLFFITQPINDLAVFLNERAKEGWDSISVETSSMNELKIVEIIFKRYK